MIEPSTRINRTQQSVEPQAAVRSLVARPVTAVTATGAGSAQVLLTIPSDQLFQFGGVIASNHTGSAVAFSLHVVPSGGSAGSGNIVSPAKSIAANDAVEILQNKSLIAPAGSTIEVHAGSTPAINLTLWGVLISSGDPL